MVNGEVSFDVLSGPLRKEGRFAMEFTPGGALAKEGPGRPGRSAGKPGGG